MTETAQVEEWVDEAGRRLAGSAATWRVVPLDGGGWAAGQVGARSNLGIVVTASGRLATLPVSAFPVEDARRLLAEASGDVVGSWPDVVAGRGPVDADAAVRLVRARLGDPAGEAVAEAGEGGWVVSLGSARAVVSSYGASRVLGPDDDAAEQLLAVTVPNLVELLRRAEEGG